MALRTFAFITVFAHLSSGILAAEECVQASASLLPTSVPDIKVPSDLWLPPSVVNTDDYKNAKNWKPVQVCGVPADEKVCTTDDSSFPTLTKATIGKVPQFSTPTTLDILQQAVSAWNGGAGAWPQMSLAARCEAVGKFLQLIEESQNELATALMWEIGKSWPDALSEVTRTIQFGRAVIAAIQSNDPDIASDEMLSSGSHRAWMRRAAIGIVLALGPYNYPINETYATLIPALLMGNICILKIPTVGGLVHLLTMEAFSKALPAGTIHFVAGSGRATMPPMMKSGEIDALAFIGGSGAADELIASHPHPHRLKVFLQLEANNMAIYLKDLFESKDKVLLNNALEQAIIGSLSYNGQRCTALKVHFVPTAHAAAFAQQLAERVAEMSVGLPWQQHAGDKYSKITPLPTDKRIQYMQELLQDALAKGAKIVNPNGGEVLGGPESTLMRPAVLFPVTSDMRIYVEEQFGPLVPVVPYDDLETIKEFARDGIYGQQASIFGHDAAAVASLVDPFSSVFGKINLNRQCGRSPDEWPFSGRRSSAMGSMSVTHALREFSTPTLVSFGGDEEGSDFVQQVAAQSKFLQPVNP
eukprot:scaffold2383_cov161-Amphora_coffeaeformis.AAC.19